MVSINSKITNFKTNKVERLNMDYKNTVDSIADYLVKLRSEMDQKDKDASMRESLVNTYAPKVFRKLNTLIIKLEKSANGF